MRFPSKMSLALGLIAAAALVAGCGEETSVNEQVLEAEPSEEGTALAEEISGCLTDAGLTASVASGGERNNLRSDAEVKVQLGTPGDSLKARGDDARVLIITDPELAAETATGLNESDPDQEHTANGPAVLQYPVETDPATVSQLESCVL